GDISGGVKHAGLSALNLLGAVGEATGLAAAARALGAEAGLVNQATGLASLRKATQMPRGGGGVVLRDGASATAEEIAASRGGPTAGARGAAQAAARDKLLAEQGDGPYTCWRCGQETTNPDNVHAGHRNVSASEGGNLEDVNMCLEGAACNLSSG